MNLDEDFISIRNSVIFSMAEDYLKMGMSNWKS